VEIPATREPLVPPRRLDPGADAALRAQPPNADATTDEVEDALAVLQANPYGPNATAEQERACRLLYRALITRLSIVCRRLGLDDEEVVNVVHPELHQFFTRDVRRIGPTRADLERWMTTVCRNAARTAIAARLRHAERDREAARLLEIDAEDADETLVPETPGVAADEPRWLETPFPARIDRDRFVAALASLTRKERLLLDTAFQHLRARDGRRLPATEIARELGATPASVSVRWSELLAKLRRACGAPLLPLRPATDSRAAPHRAPHPAPHPAPRATPPNASPDAPR
jgi:RNA polymerase sigma factor (sigma-70 family)